jgi:glycosyltransferase involved in cell wall biosynthesis
VIVVDDGSLDATANEAALAGATVLRRDANGGKGCALRDGWEEARRAGFTWALSLDGDGQHAPEDIPQFFACAEQTSARLIIGDRTGRLKVMPPLRRWANRWMSSCLSNLTGVRLPDSQCGFRLAHLDTLLGMRLTAHRFVIESEMLVAFLAAGEKVEFVPIQVIYKSNPSRICPFRDSIRWLRWWTAQSPVVPS